MFKDTKQNKEELRKQYRTIRKDVDESYSNYAANSLINLFNKNLSCVKSKTIAAYIPTDGEINVVPLMHHLLDLGYKVAIPNKNKLLKFEEWNKADEDIIPDTIITPVIAFDDHFNRLGFGGGWYDEMIKKLRPLGKIFIGVAYEKQYCKNLPVEKHDQKLDIIITEICVRFESELLKKADKKEMLKPVLPFLSSE
ncbi:5-formyltetrahydrofolate cyclo-ligase [Wolbachia endosymbiont of Trichogramma pretiosum]|uniref:5-formyltetrahydrofolate cyclo-ligase n=1 Tax=Wolbachia endosymbiont of Trichogramma pretiosum TaxID=125593 RepID=UPI000839154D|nr:5-formyltetrahydrofolate cyclo-ligase [Wolbachia endosymbiont of Trichogramma pretiosum]OCA06588.1 5-formyltetrahydrofolate cyclo-ligase [Wolbachia endosymbiont of Trichogramma pretiosum]